MNSISDRIIHDKDSRTLVLIIKEDDIELEYSIDIDYTVYAMIPASDIEPEEPAQCVITDISSELGSITELLPDSVIEQMQDNILKGYL